MSPETDTGQSQSPLAAAREDYPPTAAIDAAKREVLDYLDDRDYYVLLGEVWEQIDIDTRTVTVAIEELQADGEVEMESAVRRTGGSD